MREIVRGEQAVFNIELAIKRSETDILDAFDASNFDTTIPSAAKVCFAAGGKLIEKTWDEVDIDTTNAVNGKIIATLQGSETDSFPANSVGTIQIIYVDDTDPTIIRKFQILMAFQIIEKIC